MSMRKSIHMSLHMSVHMSIHMCTLMSMRKSMHMSVHSCSEPRDATIATRGTPAHTPLHTCMADKRHVWHTARTAT